MSVDTLTNLVTRQQMFDAVDERFFEEVPDDLVVFSAKVARFKNLNDGFGDELGDKIIKTLARRLSKTFPNALFIARMASSNFSFIFKGLGENWQTELDKLIDFCERPIIANGEVVVLSVYVGISLSKDYLYSSTDDLIHGAEIAQHYALQEQKKFVVFNKNLKDIAYDDLSLENDLRVAIVNSAGDFHDTLPSDKFLLVFQPIIDLSNGKIASFEVLIRWRHPKRGVLLPQHFIQLSEKINVMPILGRWIINRSLVFLKQFESSNKAQRPSISINVSPTQLRQDSTLIEELTAAIESRKIDSTLIKLEIKESEELSEGSKSLLKDLKGLGCMLSLDDFGTGFSSLNLLSELPYDFIKVDRVFVKDLDSENQARQQKAQKLVQAIISIAKIFDMKTIIEGVETEAQRDIVTALNADFMQGYLYSKPIDEDEAIALFQQQCE